MAAIKLETISSGFTALVYPTEGLAGVDPHLAGAACVPWAANRLAAAAYAQGDGGLTWARKWH
ncbi:MAG: hypothetical protein NVSMB4_04690 [Acidimicrobiales bacterium]